MVKLAEHTSGDATRILYLGNSGAGKTGSLVSLVEAGYNLRILDMDNGVGILKQFILNQLEIKRNNILSLFEGSYA